MIGYEFLLSRIDIPMLPLQQPARVMHVTRVESMPERRKNSPELALLKSGQLDEIEDIVAEAFGLRDGSSMKLAFAANGRMASKPKLP